ncbi:MAG: DNA-formamidopyrimidine glycosylase family protein [bacterium]
MPELPELEVLREYFSSLIRNKTIISFIVLKPYILKNYFQGDLTGQAIEHIQRQGKYLVFELTSMRLICHLMLRGALRFLLPGAKIRKTAAAVIEFTDHSKIEFSEMGYKKRMSLHIVPPYTNLRQIERLGIDPLSNDFTLKKLSFMLNAKARQLKPFLKDQAIISGLGNTYADEILWLACLSPFKTSSRLSDDEIKHLYTAIRNVLEGAITIIREKGVTEKRSFLQIHRRKGKPCPRCKEKIHHVSFSNSDTFYCPKCQTGGRVLKDRRMSKFSR